MALLLCFRYQLLMFNTALLFSPLSQSSISSYAAANNQSRLQPELQLSLLLIFDCRCLSSLWHICAIAVPADCVGACLYDYGDARVILQEKTAPRSLDHVVSSVQHASIEACSSTKLSCVCSYMSMELAISSSPRYTPNFSYPSSHLRSCVRLFLGSPPSFATKRGAEAVRPQAMVTSQRCNQCNRIT